MKTRTRLCVAMAVFCLIVSCAAISLADQNVPDVLSVVPEEAAGFAVVNRLGATDAKIGQLIEATELPMNATPLSTVKALWGIKEGLDEKGSMAVVALPAEDPDGIPVPLIIVPVADYQAFIDNFSPEKVTDAISRVTVGNDRALVAAKGNYALFVETHHQTRLESVLAGEKNIAEKVVAWQSWIDQSDVVVVLTQAAVERFAKQVDDEFEKVKPMFEAMGEQGAQAKAGLEAYQTLLNTVAGEVSLVGVSVTIEEDSSIRLASRGCFAEDSKIAGWVKDVKPLAANPWSGVPNDPFAFAVAGSVPEGAMQGLMDISLKMSSNMQSVYGFDEAQMKKLFELSAQSFTDVESISMVFGVPAEGQPLYEGTTGVFFVKDGKTFIDQYAELIKSIGDMAAEAEPSMFKNMTATPIDIDSHKAIELSVDLSGLYDNEQFAMAVPMFKAMYGPEPAMKAYLVAADDKTVTFSYINKGRAAETVKAIAADKSLAADPTVAAVAKRLPADAQWIGLWSPGGTVKLAQQVINTMAPKDSAITLPEFPATPPVAFAAHASSTEVRKELLLPVEVLKQVPAYINQFMMQRQAGTDDQEVEEVEEVETID